MRLIQGRNNQRHIEIRPSLVEGASHERLPKLSALSALSLSADPEAKNKGRDAGRRHQEGKVRPASPADRPHGAVQCTTFKADMDPFLPGVQDHLSAGAR